MFEARVAELETLARDQGLDFFPVSFEVVPHDIMTEVAAYGLPTRARHWSYGKVYQHQHLYGTMGLSKIYEMVLNSDPGLAFLLDSNPEIANLLVAAHVFGHVDFFKNNLCFADTNRRMVNDAVAHALRIDTYIEKSADFARPILIKLRKLVHAACPDVEETMKWQFPSSCLAAPPQRRPGKSLSPDHAPGFRVLPHVLQTCATSRGCRKVCNTCKSSALWVMVTRSKRGCVRPCRA